MMNKKQEKAYEEIKKKLAEIRTLLKDCHKISDDEKLGFNFTGEAFCFDRDDGCRSEMWVYSSWCDAYEDY